MVDFIRLEVDLNTVASLEEYSHLLPEIAISASARIRHGLRSIIMGTFEEALIQAGSGFPVIYQEHLREGLVRLLQPDVYSLGDGLVAQVGDIADLGDENDLYQAFHYHAIAAIDDPREFSVSTPYIIELPYEGEELYNEFEKRYDYWVAMVDGQPYTVTFGGGNRAGKNGKLPPVHQKTFSTAGQYEATLAARVAFWGNRYPEWIILDQGTEWYPSCPATHIRYFIENNCYDYMQQIIEDVADEMVRAWESSRATIDFESHAGDVFDPRGRGSKFRNPSTGRFA